MILTTVPNFSVFPHYIVALCICIKMQQPLSRGTVHICKRDHLKIQNKGDFTCFLYDIKIC